MDDLGLALVAAGAGGLSWRGHELVLPKRPPRRPAASTSQTPRPGASHSTPPIPRTFDPIFIAHGHGFPVAYLRSLAWHESRLNPKARSTKSSATGLFQVLDVVRNDHNRIHGTSYTRSDLADPTVNVTVGTAALRRMVKSLTRNHANTPNLVEDWNNYRWVELITAGWNGGYSERCGLGRVARHLEQLGITDITVELVVQHAIAAGATKHLNAQRLPWWKAVARHYAAERARDANELDTGPFLPTFSVANAEPISSPSQAEACLDEPVSSPSQAEACLDEPVSSPSQVDPDPAAPPEATPPTAKRAPPTALSPPASSLPSSSLALLDPYNAGGLLNPYPDEEPPLDPYPEAPEQW